MEKNESEMAKSQFSQNSLAMFINDTFGLLEEKSAELNKAKSQYTQNEITLKAKILDLEENFDQEVSKNCKEMTKNNTIIAQLKEKITNFAQDKTGQKELQTLDDNQSTFQDENQKNDDFTENSTIDQSDVGNQSSVVNEEKIETKKASSRYECEDCDKTYANPESLRRHKVKIHIERENLEEYLCLHCQKKFKFKEDLTNHIRIHQKKIDCNICDAKFTRRDNYLKHLRKMHNQA